MEACTKAQRQEHCWMQMGFQIEGGKARLVAQGFTQQWGKDYDSTFAPVAIYASIRTIIAIAAERKIKLHAMDAITAYLNSVLDIPIYMEQPESFVEEGKEDHVCMA